MTQPSIYLAGPTVFMPDKVERGEELKRLCAAACCEGLYPLDNVLGDGSDAHAIAQGCLEMLQRAEAVVADLSPFRGPHVDDGTAVEIGYAVARGIPVFGYSDDLRSLASRIARDTSRAGMVDAAGITIEDLGEPFNAMVAGVLEGDAYPSASEAIGAASVYLRRRSFLNAWSQEQLNAADRTDPGRRTPRSTRTLWIAGAIMLACALLALWTAGLTRFF